MEQSFFNFHYPDRRRHRAIREVMVVTLREIPARYGVMNHPDRLVEFWRAEIERAPSFDCAKETLVSFCLNSKLRIHSFNIITTGILNRTLIHAREAFRAAISVGAGHMALAHNHPSGDPTPSPDDIRITRQMLKAGEVLDIPLLDHVIVGRPSDKNRKGYVSLKQAGLVDFSSP